MRIKKLDIQQALEAASTLPLSVIAGFSSVSLGRTPECLDPSEWVEAHFFGADQEIRFISLEGRMEAYLVEDSPEDQTIDVRIRFPNASALQLEAFSRKYITADEDGQAQIQGGRLMAKEVSQ